MAVLGYITAIYNATPDIVRDITGIVYFCHLIIAVYHSVTILHHCEIKINIKCDCVFIVVHAKLKCGMGLFKYP